MSSGAFWRFGSDYLMMSEINTLLDKASDEARDPTKIPSVEEQDRILAMSIDEGERDNDIHVLYSILDQQCFLQELLSSNTKLTDFVRSFKALNKLVEFVILDYSEYQQLKLQQRRENPSSQETPVAESMEVDKPPSPGSPALSLDLEPSLDSRWEDNSLSSFLDSNSYHAANHEDADDDEMASPEEIYQRRQQLAAEILLLDIWLITNLFVNYPRLLCKLWTVLDSSCPMLISKLTFFGKINEHLLDMKTDELVAHILCFEPRLAAKFLRHVANPQLMDFLLKLVLTDKPAASNGVLLFLKKQHFIPKLIDFLKPEYDDAVQTSAGDFLKAFIAISGNSAGGPDGAGSDTSLIGPNELTRQLVSRKMVSRLVRHMLCGGNSLSNGVGVVIEIIRKNNSDYDSCQVLYVSLESQPPTLRDPIYLGHLVKVFARNMKHFKRLLLEGSARNPLTDSKKPSVKTSFGKTIEPLGFERFKICELVAELLHCLNMILLNEAAGEETVRQRDEARLEVALKEYEKLDSQREQYIQDLKSQGDELLCKYIENIGLKDSLPISANVWVEDMVTTIDRLSITDDARESALTVRAEHRNKRAKLEADALQLESDLDSDHSAESEDTSSDDEENEPDVLYEMPVAKAPESLESEEFQFDFSGLMGENSYRDEFRISPRRYYDAEEKRLREGNIIGDQLKITLQDLNMVTIILDFFFRFPWNNFLHNVVYDIVQQLLNGLMEAGFNRYLVINLFLRGRGYILEKILRGQSFAEKYEAANNGLRLGYLGHLTLISEEIVKFLSYSNLKNLFWDPEEGQTAEEYEFVGDGEAWNHYVNHTLVETREQFNLVLGGGGLGDDYEVVGEPDDKQEPEEEDPENNETYNDENFTSKEDEPKEIVTENGKENDEDYKWCYLDKSDYKNPVGVSLEEDDYIDPNDDGNDYAKKKSFEYEDKDDADEDDDEDDADLDADDDDDLDEEEGYGLRRSKSKGDMNWDEDEQRRLLTMANYIHNNTGGSAVEH